MDTWHLAVFSMGIFNGVSIPRSSPRRLNGVPFSLFVGDNISPLNSATLHGYLGLFSSSLGVL